MPTGRAITSPMRIASTPSSMVTGSRPMILASTGSRLPIREGPRVPSRRMPPIQRAYCTWAGTSRPSMCSSAARSTSAAINSVLPNIASMASPGMKRTERKTSTLRMNRVGMISSNRRMMYALISWWQMGAGRRCSALPAPWQPVAKLRLHSSVQRRVPPRAARWSRAATPVAIAQGAIDSKSPFLSSAHCRSRDGRTYHFLSPIPGHRRAHRCSRRSTAGRRSV